MSLMITMDKLEDLANYDLEFGSDVNLDASILFADKVFSLKGSEITKTPWLIEKSVYKSEKQAKQAVNNLGRVYNFLPDFAHAIDLVDQKRVGNVVYFLYDLPEVITLKNLMKHSGFDLKTSSKLKLASNMVSLLEKYHEYYKKNNVEEMCLNNISNDTIFIRKNSSILFLANYTGKSSDHILSIVPTEIFNPINENKNNHKRINYDVGSVDVFTLAHSICELITGQPLDMSEYKMDKDSKYQLVKEMPKELWMNEGLWKGNYEIITNTIRKFIHTQKFKLKNLPDYFKTLRKIINDEDEQAYFRDLTRNSGGVFRNIPSIRRYTDILFPTKIATTLRDIVDQEHNYEKFGISRGLNKHNTGKQHCADMKYLANAFKKYKMRLYNNLFDVLEDAIPSDATNNFMPFKTKSNIGWKKIAMAASAITSFAVISYMALTYGWSVNNLVPSVANDSSIVTQELPKKKTVNPIKKFINKPPYAKLDSGAVWNTKDELYDISTRVTDDDDSLFECGLISNDYIESADSANYVVLTKKAIQKVQQDKAQGLESTIFQAPLFVSDGVTEKKIYVSLEVMFNGYPKNYDAPKKKKVIKQRTNKRRSKGTKVTKKSKPVVTSSVPKLVSYSKNSGVYKFVNLGPGTLKDVYFENNRMAKRKEDRFYVLDINTGEINPIRKKFVKNDGVLDTLFYQGKIGKVQFDPTYNKLFAFDKDKLEMIKLKGDYKK